MTAALEGIFFDPDGVRGPARLAWDDGGVREVRPLPALGEAALPATYRILPGFIDGHTHLMGLGFEFLRPNFVGVATREEVFARLDTWLRAHPGTSPVIGEGWDQSLWADPTPPRREELDRVVSDRPVAIRRVCGHIAVLNSRALETLPASVEGVDAETGLAREHLPLTLSRHWPPVPAEMDEAIRLGQEEAWRRGVTGIHEMGHAGTFRAFGRANVAGRLHLRVSHYFAVELRETLERAGLVPGFGDDRLRVAGLKLFLDGSIGGRTAAVREPYPDRVERGRAGGPEASDDGRGMLLYEDAALAEALRGAAAAGFPPALHAIGDRAIEQVIRVVECLAADGVTMPPPGPRLEHAEMLDAGLLERGARAGFRFSMQPNFTARWQGAEELYEQVLGAARARALNPYRSAAATGRLLFGSDTMPLDPLLGLRGACGHPDPAERLSLDEAVRRYTSAVDAAVPAPFGGGGLRVGAGADFVVLRTGTPAGGKQTLEGPEFDPFDPSLLVAATCVGGRFRFVHPEERILLAGASA